MKFDPVQVRNGNSIRSQLNENPESFATSNTASKGGQNTTTLDAQNNRMAGYMGARAIELASNPVEAKRTADWNNQFMGNEYGVRWQQAKMGLA